MKNRILFLGSLCLVLALSLAFTGCAEDDPVFSGDPIPAFLTGTYVDSDDNTFALTAEGMQYQGAAPYRISFVAGDIEEDYSAGTDCTLTLYLFAAPFAEVGEITFDYSGSGDEITITTMTQVYPYGIPSDGVYTRQ